MIMIIIMIIMIITITITAVIAQVLMPYEGSICSDNTNNRVQRYSTQDGIVNLSKGR